MTITVSGLNYTQIAAGESVTGDTGVGGTWSGDSPAPDPGSFLEGSNSMSFVIKSSSGIRYATFTPTSSIDLSGIKHVRFWFLSILGSYILAKASGGIMFYCTDGANTGYWNLDGSDTYNGGWKNMVVDVSRAVDSGTKPTNMNAITALGVALQLGTGGKNVASVWIDNLSVGDGLICYGDDAGGYFDFQDIYAADSATTGGWGVITRTGGAYFLTGAIQIGDSASTNSCKFQATSQTVIFEDRGSDINSSLMGIDVVDNGTGTTEFILGEKSGTAGISGCNIRVASTSQTSKFYIDGSTDTDVDNFKLYGSSFLDASSITTPAAGANVEALNCSFESCGEVVPSTSVVTNCNFVSANDIGIRMSSTSHAITYCKFISCGHGINISGGTGSYTFTGLNFTNCTYDIENSGTSAAVTVNVTTGTGSNPSTYENTAGGTTTINNVVTLKLTVKDPTGAAIVGARCMMEAGDGTGAAPFLDSVGITSSGTVATVTHTAHGLSNGQMVNIRGCTQPEYNGAGKVITYISVDSYSYTISGSPASPATGSPTSTQCFLSETSIAGGIAQEDFNAAGTQPYRGRVRYATTPPYYEDVTFSGTDCSAGLDLPIQMGLDQ